MINKIKSLKDNQGFMKYFKNTSWLFGEKVLRMVVGLFVGIWVARYLGPEQFGLFSYVQSFVGLFIAFSTLGLDAIVVRELVKDESRRDELIGTTFWLKVMGAVGVILILSIAINFTSNDTHTNTLVFIIASSTIFQSFNVIDFYFQSKVLSRYIVYANVTTLFLSSIIKVALILNEASLIAFALVIAFDSFVLACGFIYFYLKNSPTFKFKSLIFKKEIALSLLKDSWPLILSAVVVSIYMKIDQVMIKEMLDIEAVGHYAAAVRLSAAWYFIPVVISASLFPAIVNAKQQNQNIYYEKLQKFYDFMVLMAILIAIPMTFFSNWIVNLLFGSAFHEAGDVLMIHIWTGIFVFLTVSSGKYLVAENMVMKTFYRNASAMIINVLLNIYLIRSYGINGAAVATLISWVVSGYLYDLFDKDVRFMFVQKTKSLTGYSILKRSIRTK
jgi:O-antigen/teichoic acid export membrane protein